MTLIRCLALTVGLAVLVTAGGAAFARPAMTSTAVAKPRTLAVVTGATPDAFAATASGAAWIDAVVGCKERIRRIHVLSFGERRPHTLRFRLCSEFGEYGPISLDHRRAVWIRSTFGNTFYEGRVFIAGPGDRAATTLQRFQFDRGGPVEPSVLVAGDAKGSVIAVAGPVLRVVRRRARLLFSGSGSAAIDVSGNRIAVIRPEVPADVYARIPPHVEVHERGTGALLASFELAREDPSASIAVSADTVAVWGFDGGSLRVDSYDLRGRKIASKRLGGAFSPSGTDAIGIVGRRVVYSRGRAIHAWNPRTGADEVIAISRRNILNFVVTGRRAIWTQRVDARRFAILGVNIPIR